MKILSLTFLTVILASCATYENAPQTSSQKQTENISATSPNTSRTQVTPKPRQDDCNDSCSRFGELSQSKNTVPEVCNCETKKD